MLFDFKIYCLFYIHQKYNETSLLLDQMSYMLLRGRWREVPERAGSRFTVLENYRINYMEK